MLAFKQSLQNPAITSGRNANCFFQSFIHVFSQLPNEVHQQLLNDERYKLPLQHFVKCFNQIYATLLPEDFNFKEIIEFSKTLHPLDRELIFGLVLRTTYNVLVEAEIIQTEPLGLGDDDIVFAHQTIAFANCFGARLSAYMLIDEFEKARDTMPVEKAQSILNNKIDVNGTRFVCDSCDAEKNQLGIWKLNLVFAGIHLNYTLGTSELNQIEKDKVVIDNSNSATFATGPADPQSAPLFSVSTRESFDKKLGILFSMKKADILGISVATVKSEGSISTMTLGVTDKDSTPITKDTVFGAASLSKPLFAYLVLKLIEANKSNHDQLSLGKGFLPDGMTEFNLDSPLFKILPLQGLSKNPSDLSNAKALTARMVLLHVTGLPIVHDDKKGPLKFQFQPNTEYGYSGVGFAYLQKVIEKD